MFSVPSSPASPFTPPLGRKYHWYDLRPTGPQAAFQKDQYFNCDDGPTTPESFHQKYDAAAEFWRKWLFDEKPRAMKEISLRLRLTFNGDGELVPECLYPLVALYGVVSSAKFPTKIKRINVYLTKTHWFLWRGALDEEPWQYELPLEKAVDWGRVGASLGIENANVPLAAEEVLPGCHWGFPRVLRSILTPYLSFLGVSAEGRQVSWHGASAEEMIEAAAEEPPLAFRF